MVRCHHRLTGHESEQTPGDGEGQGAWHAAAGHKELDTTEGRSNNVGVDTPFQPPLPRSPHPDPWSRQPNRVVLKISWT